MKDNEKILIQQPIIEDSFYDFIYKSFGHAINNDGEHIYAPITPIYLMFRKITMFYKELYDNAKSGNLNLNFSNSLHFNICLDKDIKNKLLSNTPSSNMIFYGAILGIYIPFLNVSILVKHNKDDTFSFYYYSTNIFITYIGYTLIKRGEEFCIKFFRLNTRPEGSMLFYYCENRFNVYDNNMDDLKEDFRKLLLKEDGTLNKNRVFNYMYNVFDSLSKEIADSFNINVIYIDDKIDSD